MATTSESIVFEQRPIEEWLANFRHLFITTQNDLSINVSSDAIQDIFSTATNEGMAKNLGISFLY